MTTRCGEGHPGLEIVYLLGNFGVALEGASARIIAPPARLAVGDWTRQGLPFYAGHAAYGKTAVAKLTARERVFLVVSGFHGTALCFWCVRAERPGRGNERR